MATLRLFNADVSRLEVDAIALIVRKNYALTAIGKSLDRVLHKGISSILKSESFQIKDGNVQVFYPGKENSAPVCLVASAEDGSNISALRDAACTAVKTGRKRSYRSIAIAFDPRTENESQAIGEGALLGGYEYDRYKTEKSARPGLRDIYILTSMKAERAIERARIFAEATITVRDLVNEPPNILNVGKLMQVAQKTARENRLEIRIFNANQLEKMGANAFLSVGKGSVTQGKMVHLMYRPRGKTSGHVAIVGKGILFDSGGLSLKNDQQMLHMKSDMAGAATALVCAAAAAQLKLQVSVSAILMLTENMPDGGANRPGDVVRAMNGKTIEITNTDAEGRLALADGLTYAARLDPKPDVLLDIATLTGAQIIALGKLVGAIMGNNPRLLQQLSMAGELAGETMWPLPLPDKYKDLIKSDTADVKNSSGLPEAGSIQAGLFLSEFVDHSNWAHLDIAGPSWQDREWGVYARNASGFGPRCLLTFLFNLAGKSRAV